MLSNFCPPKLKKFVTGEQPVRLCGRKSPLSIAQISEIEMLLKNRYPQLRFIRMTVNTSGDIDKVTSLEQIKKRDFFTDAVDQLILNNTCDIGIHSTKDLPSPLPKGISLIAKTRTIHPGDSLIYHPKFNPLSLPKNLIIGTSSDNRKATIKSLFPNFEVQDIRGNIGERLDQLHLGIFDGIVVAEAALIRLKSKIANKISLPPPYTPFQGSLAITARKNNEIMRELMYALDDGNYHPLKISYSNR